jgi:ketosteroid isomerase-like protein
MLDQYAQRLLDEFACRRLIEAYWYTESRRDADALADLFTADGRWGSATGREELVTQAQGFFTMMAGIAQNPTGFAGVDLRVDDDHATGFVHGIAHLVVPRDGGPTTIVVVDAVYDLEFRREAGEWRIARMCGLVDPSAPHDATFQFEAPATAIDFGMAAVSVVHG